MSWLSSRDIPWLVTLVTALIMFIDYFFSIGPVSSIASILQKWVVVITFFALLLGSINVVSSQIRHITKRTKGQWYHSVWLVFIFGFMVVTGLSGKITTNPMFRWVYTNVSVTIGNAIYSLLAFYIVAATYRAFRARNIDSILLTISAVLVMLFSAPFGGLLWPGFNILGLWILDVPSTAVQRAIIITSVVGMVTLAVRVLMGQEKGVAFRGE